MGDGFLGGGPYLRYRTTNVSRALTDENFTIACTVPGITLTLPPAILVAIGRIFIIKAISLSEGSATIATSGTDTIDGGATTSVTANQSIMVQSNGNGAWFILASH